MKTKLQRLYDDLEEQLRIISNKMDVVRSRINLLPEQKPEATPMASVPELAALWT